MAQADRGKFSRKIVTIQVNPKDNLSEMIQIGPDTD